MNTQKEVFNRLFKEEKTELSVERVELALIDDVKTISKEFDSIFSKMDKAGDELGRLLGDSIRKKRELESLNDKNQTLVKEAISLIQKVEKTSKELGVNKPKEVEYLIKKYKDSAEYNSIARGIGKIPQV